MKNCLIQNRQKIYDSMEDNTVLLLFSGYAPIKMDTEPYPFTPDRNFLNMTGLADENVAYWLFKHGGKMQQSLFVPRQDPQKAQWIGALRSRQQMAQLSGIEDIDDAEALKPKLEELIKSKGIQTIYLDLQNHPIPFSTTQAVFFANTTSQNQMIHGARVQSATKMLTDIRLVKSDYAIAQIRKAIDITGEAFSLILKNAKQGMMEHEVEAYFDYVLKKHGAREAAFNTIVASGDNAVILHYDKNCRKTQADDLILMDFGAAWQYYSADITRTFPVSGRFTKRQRMLYDMVLEGQLHITQMMKPGVPFAALNAALIQYYVDQLPQFGLIDKQLSVEEKQASVARYYYHQVSHSLGLQTHDPGSRTIETLKPGMVLTVEPGLYIPEEHIGIRIEDDILITQDGCENLSAAIPKTVKEIESHMAAGR